MKSLTRIMLVAALAVLPMLAASPAQGAKKMEVALQDDGVFLYNEHYNAAVGYRQLRELGVTHLRMNILWWQPIPEAQRNQRTKPSPIVYDWRVWDAAIARARAYGMKVQLDLAGDPPAWACGNKRPPYACDGFKPNRSLFAHFVRAAVNHFQGRVSRFSLWNEPNWYTWISPHKQSPILYRKLYQAGYKAAKKANKKAEVVMGELAPHFRPGLSIAPLKFLRGMVCVNKKLKRTKGANKKCGRKPLKLDAFAHHPYDFEHKPTKKRSNKDEVTMANIGQLSKFLDKLRKKGLIKPSKKKFPIYLTEYGYMVSGNPDVRRERRIPEAKRAKWLVQAWDIAQRTPRIKQMINYILVSPPLGSPSSYFDTGLIAANGTIRQSYNALENWIQQALSRGQVTRPGAVLRLLAVAGLAVLPMLAAPPAQAGKQMEVALQDDGVFLYEEHYDRDLAYRQLRALGATHLRMNILWWQPIPAGQRTQTTVPSNITYDWGVWDNAINRARDFGIEVQLDLAGDPPAWACGNLRPPYACDGYKPNRELFAHFVGAAVSHFKGRVSRYSMWNEPNWYTWISPHKQSPILYRKLYQAGYDAAKAADPTAEVVMGELAPHFQKNISMPPLEFVRKMFCVNKRLKRTKNANSKCGT